MDKEKLEKIIEKIVKRNQIMQDFLEQMNKYSLNSKDVEYLESLPKSLSEIEKSHDKLSKVVEGFVRDLEATTKKTSKEVSGEKREKVVVPDAPIEIVDEPAVGGVADPEPVIVPVEEGTPVVVPVEEGTPVVMPVEESAPVVVPVDYAPTPAVEPAQVETVDFASTTIPEPMVLEDTPVMTL